MTRLWCSGLHSFFFFFTDPAPPDIYTLSLHDALPIWFRRRGAGHVAGRRLPGDIPLPRVSRVLARLHRDRKSTRLNSSHPSISYAVFCLKKKNRHIGSVNLACGLVAISAPGVVQLHAS